MKKVVIPAFIVLLSMLGALFGMGFSYWDTISIENNHGEFSGLHRDKWFEQSAEVRFKELSSIGNRAYITIAAPRPAETSAIAVGVSVCDIDQQEFAISGPTSIAVSLRGDCDPRLIRLSVKEADLYAPGGTESRKLGAQILSVSVTSRLGIPLVSPVKIAFVGLGIAATALLFYFIFFSTFLSWGAFLIVAFSFDLLADAPGIIIKNPYNLWIFATSLLLGIAIAQK